jgi:hypothetical protein
LLIASIATELSYLKSSETLFIGTVGAAEDDDENNDDGAAAV